MREDVAADFTSVFLLALKFWFVTLSNTVRVATTEQQSSINAVLIR